MLIYPLPNYTVRSLDQAQAGNIGVPGRGQAQGTATQQYNIPAIFHFSLLLFMNLEKILAGTTQNNVKIQTQLHVGEDYFQKYN